MPLSVKPDQSRLTTLLTDTVILLCKNGLNFQSTLRIVGVLGITIDDSDVFIVHLNETVSSVAPDTPNATSYSNTIDKPTAVGVEGRSGFHTEKRVVSHMPRPSKMSARTSKKPTSDVQELKSKGSTPPEDHSIKTDRGARETDRASEIRIKEENIEDSNGGLTETTDKSLRHGQEVEDCRTQVSSRDNRTYKWAREIGHVSISDPVDYAGGSNEMFVQNDGQAVDSCGGMDTVDEWNLDMVALSSLPGASEGDAVPPWPGYASWRGGTYANEYLSGSQSQSMVSPKTRAVRDGLVQSDVERHGFALLKPFACPVVGCNRRFYHRNNVYRHRKQKHGENVLDLVNRRR